MRGYAHTLPVNHSELQNQRVGCVRYAPRGCLIDGLPFQFLDDLKGRLKVLN